MRKVLPFALGIVVSSALLGFALRHGVDIVRGSDDDLGFTGWQYRGMRWGLVGGAVLLAVLGVVWVLRRSRRLEGEGLLYAVPAILAGLLLSGVPSAAASPAETWASHQTSDWKAGMREQRAFEVENKLHPVPVPMNNFPAPPTNLALDLPSLSDLGPGWYEGQRPAVTGLRVGRGANTSFNKATAIPGGWSFDRVLWVRLHDYDTVAEAVTKGSPAPNKGSVPSTRRVGKVVFTLRETRPSNGIQDSIVATTRVGTRVWSVYFSSGQPKQLLQPAEVTEVLTAVAAKVS